MNAIADLCEIVPGWVWMLICVGLLLSVAGVSTVAYVQVAGAQREAAQARETLAQERERHTQAVLTQGEQIRVAEKLLAAARTVQEKKDAENQITISNLRVELDRRSAAGRGLRDPFAPACDRGGDARSGPAAVAGGADPAEAGRLLSAGLERLLLDLAAEADAINAAYETCRADAVRVRSMLRSLSPPVVPALPGQQPASPSTPG